MERNPRLPSIDVWSINEGNIIYSEWFAIKALEEIRKFCTNIRATNTTRIEELRIFPSNWYNRFHKLCVCSALCILQRSKYEMADIVEAMKMKRKMINRVRERYKPNTFTFDVSSDWLLNCILSANASKLYYTHKYAMFIKQFLPSSFLILNRKQSVNAITYHREWEREREIERA